MVRAAVLIAVLVAFGVALAGCGGRSTETVTVTTTVGTTGTTTTGSEAPASAPIVDQLQRVMTRLGYYSGPIDGVYGDQTTAAVKTMQEDLSVTADGIYGPETDAALKAKAKSIVLEMQTTLQNYGYYDGELDGEYGSATQDAVTKLQTDLGVTADGRFGPETAAAFNEAVDNGTIKPA